MNLLYYYLQLVELLIVTTIINYRRDLYLYLLLKIQILKTPYKNKGDYMATGKIKWFNPTKGYGFIENDAGGKDVFLHISALEEAGIDQLQEGEAVSFEIGENRGKENAINVKKVS